MSNDTMSSKMTTGTCPVYPGIQFLGDLTVAPERPRIAARLAASGISHAVYSVLRGRTGTCGFCGAHLTRICGQWLSGPFTFDGRNAGCAAPAALYGRHARKPDTLRDIPAPPRGSGQVTCCGNHR